MKNLRNPTPQYPLTAIAFLEHVMPQIKINQKTFPLIGIQPEGTNKTTVYASFRITSDHPEE